MEFGEVAMILFSCVAVNHLGLVATIEDIIRHRIPIVDCPKCLTFWAVLTYGLLKIGFTDIPLVLAVGFLCAYLAKWFHLLMAYIDILFNMLYDKIYTTEASSDDGA